MFLQRYFLEMELLITPSHLCLSCTWRFILLLFCLGKALFLENILPGTQRTPDYGNDYVFLISQHFFHHYFHMEAPSFDRDGRMAETFTWSGSKIPFSLSSTITFLIFDDMGKMGMEYVCFFVSATGRRKMARVDEMEIREEEQLAR